MNSEPIKTPSLNILKELIADCSECQQLQNSLNITTFQFKSFICCIYVVNNERNSDLMLRMYAECSDEIFIINYQYDEENVPSNFYEFLVELS